MSVNFTVGIYKYATIPNTKTAKIGDAISQHTSCSGISDVNYSRPVEIPSYVYYKNIKYEIVEIGISAFRRCRCIPKVTIPPTIITIRTWAFDWLISCKEIVFLPGSKLTTISSDSFCRCYSITTLVIPNSVRTIENNALPYLKSLKYLYICGNPSIGADIFKDSQKGNDEVAPDDLVIYVPFEFTGSSEKRNFTKSYYNKVCDFTIKCNSCSYCSYYFYFSYLLSEVILS